MGGETSKQTEDPSPPSTLEKKTTKILGDVRLVLILAAFFGITLPGGGWLALAKVRDEAREEVRPLIPRIEALEGRQVTTDAVISESNRRWAGIERTVMVIDLNTRLALETRGIRPIDIPKNSDGGMP